ncbi:MAG: histidinol-phosphatase [Bacteroidales bacterium]|nr:histidinol-phosphatase [Bacteroidales bacterium]
MQHFNLHTHSTFSDGKSPMEDTVKEAIRQGMHTLGFSDHSSVPFESRVSIPMDKNDEYVGHLKELKTKYLGQIDILSSMEMEFIPGIVVDFDKIKAQYHLDYLIGSVHLVGKSPDTLWFIDGKSIEPYDEGLKNYFGGDIKKGVRAYFDQENEMIETEKFDIIGHFDKVKMNARGRYFHEDEKWYRDMVFETLDLIKQHDLIVEINTRGLYKQRYNGFYPSEWLLPRMKELNIPVVISSDAHLSEELTYYFKEAEEALKNVGYKETMCFKNGHWEPLSL